ncbi:MAG: S-layer homology domain-containing protein [Clostridia bacterium]|nr:S-layer homology domain-containing protein [Clostridia bacterium]
MNRKRLISIALALVLALTLLPAAMAADLPFTDVPANAWYSADVQSAYELGLINGKSADKFAPDDNMTYAEAVKLAACIRQKDWIGEVTLENGDPWYQPYVDFAKEWGIIYKDYDWNAPATRAGYMEIFAHALDLDKAEQNYIPMGAIPDIPITHPQAYEIYMMYRAGIVQGVDQNFNCSPDSYIRRSDVAAILSRMMDVDRRKSFSIPYPAETGAPDFDHAAAKAINDFLAEGILPDGRDIAFDDGIAYDWYAVCDVDGDGKTELLITVNNAVEPVEIVYAFDPATGKFTPEIEALPDLIYYANGIITVMWPDRIGLESYDFIPYDIYRYNSAKDVYEYQTSIALWDKVAADKDFSGNPFPDDIDKDGDGEVFMFYIDGAWDGKYVDGEEADARFSEYFPTTESLNDLVDISWRALYEARG